MKELALQVEDERRQSDQYKDQVKQGNLWSVLVIVFFTGNLLEPNLIT